jgi:hypothetical protein
VKRALLLFFAGLLLVGCASHNTIQTRKQERAAAYSSLSPEAKALVDQGQIKVGMPMDAVYIAWGPPAEILRSENEAGAATVWIYRGGYLEETRYWAGWRHHPYLEHDYQPRTYVSAEIAFVNGVVKSWRTLPQPTY